MKRPETRRKPSCINNSNTNEKYTFYASLFFVLFLVLWELAADLSWINDFIFSSPKRLVACFVQMLMGGTIWQHVSITLLETMISFVLVILFYHSDRGFYSGQKNLFLTCQNHIWCTEQSAKICPSAITDRMAWRQYKTIIVTGMSVAIFGSILSLYQGFLSVDPNQMKLIENTGWEIDGISTKLFSGQYSQSVFRHEGRHRTLSGRRCNW